jgi:hypothetical protein
MYYEIYDRKTGDLLGEVYGAPNRHTLTGMEWRVEPPEAMPDYSCVGNLWIAADELYDYRKGKARNMAKNKRMDSRMTSITPLEDAAEEEVVKRVAGHIMSKPGFARTATTRDTLERGLRSAIREITEMRGGRAEQKTEDKSSVWWEPTESVTEIKQARKHLWYTHGFQPGDVVQLSMAHYKRSAGCKGTVVANEWQRARVDPTKRWAVHAVRDEMGVVFTVHSWMLEKYVPKASTTPVVQKVCEEP